MKKVAGLFFVIALIIFFLYQNQSGDTPLVTPLQVVPTSTPTPTPTPIIFNQNSNLEEEVKKLTPEDFSQDFIAL